MVRGGVHPDGLVVRCGVHPDGIEVRGGILPDGIVVRGGVHPDGIENKVTGPPSEWEAWGSIPVVPVKSYQSLE